MILTKLREFILGLVMANDETVQQLRSKIAELEVENAELKSGVEGIITEFSLDSTPDDVENPTPNADAVVKAADELPVENVPAVQEAMDSTVDTAEPTPPEAVEAAVEMLTEASESAEATETDEAF